MENKIESLIKQNEKPMTALELIESLEASAEDISAALVRMTRDGRLIFTKKGKYALPDTVGLIPARAVILRSGVPIAKPLDGSGDIRISRHGDLRAMNGDLILVRRDKHYRHNPNEKCELVAVTERAHPTFTAVLFWKHEYAGLYILFAALAGLLVLFAHRGNVLRLIRRQENRLDFKKIKLGTKKKG